MTYHASMPWQGGQYDDFLEAMATRPVRTIVWGENRILPPTSIDPRPNVSPCGFPRINLGLFRQPETQKTAYGVSATGVRNLHGASKIRG